MQNAKIPELPGDKELRAKLLAAVTGTVITTETTDPDTYGNIIAVEEIGAACDSILPCP